MVTKEWSSEKKCCLYASNYHLEMIILPYIENKIDESIFVIITQENLTETIKTLLDRINLNNNKKNKILNLNWNDNWQEKIEYIKKLGKSDKKLNIIINGNYDYVKQINNILDTIEIDNIEVVDCFSIYDKQINIENIKKRYKEFINTVKI